MMRVMYNVGGEIAVENGKIHYRGEKTGLLTVEEGIGYLDLLSRVRRVCGTESGGPLILVSTPTDDAERCRALLHNSPISLIASIASVASPPGRLLHLPEFEIVENGLSTASSTGNPLLLEYSPTNDTTAASTATEMASMASSTSPHVQVSEFETSQSCMSIPANSKISLLLESTSAITSTSPPSPDLQPTVLETPENHPSIPTSSATPLLPSSSGELKELNEKQASCDKFKIQKPKLIDTKWISSLAKCLMERDLPCGEQAIMEQISEKYGYDVDFDVVRESRNLALIERDLPCGDLDMVDQISDIIGYDHDFIIVSKSNDLALEELWLPENDEDREEGGKTMAPGKIFRRKDDASVEANELREKQGSQDIFMTGKPKLVDMEWISSLAKSLMERDLLCCTERYIIDEINNEFGYDVDFNLVWKSRNLALKQLGLLKDDTEEDDQLMGNIYTPLRWQLPENCDMPSMSTPDMANMLGGLLKDGKETEDDEFLDHVENGDGMFLNCSGYEDGDDMRLNILKEGYTWYSGSDIKIRRRIKVYSGEDDLGVKEQWNSGTQPRRIRLQVLNGPIPSIPSMSTPYMANMPGMSDIPSEENMSGSMSDMPFQVNMQGMDNTPFNVEGLSNISSTVNMQVMGNTPFMNNHGNLVEGLIPLRQSFSASSTSQSLKKVSSHSSSDVRGSQEGVSVIRASLEGFRCLIMIVSIVFLSCICCNILQGRNCLR